MEQSTFSDCLERIGAEPEYILPMGRNKAKVSIKALDDNHKQGKLILVSAITPTPSGEGAIQL